MRYLEERMGFNALDNSGWRDRPERFDLVMSAIGKIKLIRSQDQKEFIIKNTSDNKKIINDYKTAVQKDIKLVKQLPSIEVDTDIGKIELPKIAKSTYFGGKGKGGGESGKTSEGESLQCVMLAALIKNGTNKPYEFYTQKSVMEDAYKDVDVDTKFDLLLKLTDDHPQWHRSGYMIGKKLIQKGYVNKDHILYRGKTKMKEIYNLKAAAYKSEGRPGLSNDKWNPGDIYAIKRNIDVSKVLQSHSVASLNISLSKAFRDRDIVPISLKLVPEFKLDGKIKMDVYNLDRLPEKQRKFNKLVLAKKTFWSSKSATVYIDGQELDFRSFSDFTAVNMEISGKTARGGKVGYDQIRFAAKEFLKARNLPDNQKIAMDARKIHTQLSTGKIGAETKNFWSAVQRADTNIKEVDFYNYPKTRKAADVHSKLATTYVCDAIMKANNSAKNSFATNVYNIAGSQTEDSSVYIKAYV